MSRVTIFNRSTCRVIAVEMEAALQTIADKHGVSLKYKGGSFTDNTYLTRFEMCVKAVDGSTVAVETHDFALYAESYGFKKTDINREFEVNGTTYILEGIKPRSRKYSVIGRSKLTGGRYKFTPLCVQRSFK
jgi:hypothetical protein